MRIMRVVLNIPLNEEREAMIRPGSIETGKIVMSYMTEDNIVQSEKYPIVIESIREED